MAALVCTLVLLCCSQQCCGGVVERLVAALQCYLQGVAVGSQELHLHEVEELL
jgi:hypothetical protein